MTAAGYPRPRRLRHNQTPSSLRNPAMRLPLLALSLVVLAGGCTWVPIEPAGKAVRVLPAGPVPAGCVAKGEVVVSVKDKIGFIDRKARKVQDELETLARNETPSAGANAVQASAPPAAGEQRFSAWQCPPR